MIEIYYDPNDLEKTKIYVACGDGIDDLKDFIFDLCSINDAVINTMICQRCVSDGLEGASKMVKDLLIDLMSSYEGTNISTFKFY